MSGAGVAITGMIYCDRGTLHWKLFLSVLDGQIARMIHCDRLTFKAWR
ncbi:MAG: hypothetical protein ACYT04_36715 [Nostoc sp.]